MFYEENSELNKRIKLNIEYLYFINAQFSDLIFDFYLF